MSERKTPFKGGGLGAELNLSTLFPPHDYDEWKDAAIAGLKGAPFEKRLVSETPEGVRILPLYLRQHIDDLPCLGEFPGLQSRSRGGDAAGHLVSGWEIAQETADPDPAAAGRALREALDRGQTAVTLALSTAFRRGLNPRQDTGDGLYFLSAADMETLLDGVDWSACPLHFTAGTSGPALAMLLEELARRTGRDLAALQGSLNQDHLGEWVGSGRLAVTPGRAMEEMADLVHWAVTRAPNIQVVGADGRVYHEAGGDGVTELAFTLATATDYLAGLTEHGIPVDEAAPRIRFTLGVGTHFLMEIAKLRATRILWSRVVEAFGGGHAARRVRVHARTSRYHQTRTDAHVNILRAATATFAAVVGGADSIHTAPFDETFRTPGELSSRIARNTQIILDAESHFRDLIDPAGGAYAVERLTHEVATAAWDLFRQVEARGGMVRALEEGFPQERIQRVAAERARDVSTRRTVLVGTSHYANVREEVFSPEDPASRRRRAGLDQRVVPGNNARAGRLLTGIDALDGTVRISRGAQAMEAGAAPLEVLAAMRKAGAAAPTIQAVRPRRAAAAFEALRDRAQAFQKRTGESPRVFLANLGPPAQYKARAEFSRGFFEAGGFAVESSPGFDTPAAAAAAAAGSGAPVVVICSSDSAYPEWVPPLVSALRKANDRILVVLAGYPADHVEALRQAGVEEFIHLRADAVDILDRIQRRTGVAK